MRWAGGLSRSIRGCATWFRFHAALNGVMPMDWSGWNRPKRPARRLYTLRPVSVLRALMTALVEIADVILAPGKTRKSFVLVESQTRGKMNLRSRFPEQRRRVT